MWTTVFDLCPGWSEMMIASDSTHRGRKLLSMKRVVRALILSTLLGDLANSQPSPNRPPLILVQRPTIVAFFVPMTEAEANSGGGDAEALGDFNYYIYKVERRLKRVGIELQQVNGRSFKVRDGTRTSLFETGKIGVGYYFIAPGKEPHVEYGVMTDEDLVDAAKKYFGLAIPPAN